MDGSTVGETEYDEAKTEFDRLEGVKATKETELGDAETALAPFQAEQAKDDKYMLEGYAYVAAQGLASVKERLSQIEAREGEIKEQEGGFKRALDKA